MTSKTSFFNKGIYKSTVKRYSWGALLYFIILFISTGLLTILNTNSLNTNYASDYFVNYPMILDDAQIVIPMLLAMFVPTVAALLIFRFIHSKKQSVFIHSIPVSRKANFISSVAAAFTLMAVPVLLNGIILILMSVGGFGKYFTVYNCMQWIGYNIYGLFIMFSVATLACCLTGNSFAAVALNALIHGFLFLTVVAVEVIADTFVFGYTEGNILYETLAENNFFVVVFSLSDRYFRRNLESAHMIKLGVCAMAMYMGSYFLYKKRRLETATDVAGYKCLNPIFKYIITFLATVFVFAVLTSYIDENPVVIAVIVAIVGMIAYAASEMVLKKTVNVLYAWKGYVVYAVIFAGFISVFAFTSFFGYETWIPEKDDIDEVALYHYYYQTDEPFSANPEIIDIAIDSHTEIIQRDSIPLLDNTFTPYTTRLHFKYKMKDGREIYRTYSVESDKCAEIMDKLYENEEYKRKSERVFINADNVTGMFVYSNSAEEEIKEYKELLSVIQDDILNMSYTDLHYADLNLREQEKSDVAIDTESVTKGPQSLYGIRAEFKVENKENEGERAYISGIHIDITEKYEETVKWLEEHGFKPYNRVG